MGARTVALAEKFDLPYYRWNGRYLLDLGRERLQDSRWVSACVFLSFSSSANAGAILARRQIAVAICLIIASVRGLGANVDWRGGQGIPDRARGAMADEAEIESDWSEALQ